MKKNIVNRIALYILALCMGLTACDSFEEFNTNPDKSTKVTSGMLATNLILGIMQEDGTTKTFLRDDMLSKYVAWTEGNDIDSLFFHFFCFCSYCQSRRRVNSCCTI